MKLLRVFFRTVLCSALPICLILSSMTVFAYTGSSSQSKTTGTNLRVMSFNVLVDNDLDNGGWSWGMALGNRGEKASACIDYYQPDVIGLQECNYNWHVALKTGLPDYAFVNADVPEQQRLESSANLGKKDWMCTTMMYNTKTLTLLDNELIGYSVNYWGNIQRMRYISMALFEIKATGEKFVFTSTHLDAESDDKGKTMRNTQAGEMAERLNYYKNVYGCPIISTGDFNSGYSDTPIQTLVSEGMTSHTSNRGGIDYILYSAGVTAEYFTVVSDADASGASDHRPVFADLNVSNYRFNSADLLSGGETSRMEMGECRLGLGFEFTVAAKGAAMKADYTADLTNATVDTLSDGKGYSLVAVGALMSNDPEVGLDPDKMTLDNLSKTTVNVPAKYLTNADENSASFAVRVTNIPAHLTEAPIYARPYYIYECMDEQIIVYDDIVRSTYSNKTNVNDGVLDWS